MVQSLQFIINLGNTLLKMIVFLLVLGSLAQEEVYEVTLQELDTVIITDEVTESTLLEFTDTDPDEQPTRIDNNVDEISYFFLTVDGNSYFLIKPGVGESIYEEIYDGDDSLDNNS